MTQALSGLRVCGGVRALRPPHRGYSTDAQEFDLATDEEAKKRWQRAKPLGQVIGLPGYLVGGEFIGVSCSSPPGD